MGLSLQHFSRCSPVYIPPSMAWRVTGKVAFRYFFSATGFFACRWDYGPLHGKQPSKMLSGVDFARALLTLIMDPKHTYILQMAARPSQPCYIGTRLRPAQCYLYLGSGPRGQYITCQQRALGESRYLMCRQVPVSITAGMGLHRAPM